MTPGEEYSNTRMICLGEKALTQGFRLVGFETFPDATAKDLDRLLEELLQSRQRAFLLIDRPLAESGSRLLPRVMAEGGSILVAEIPPLHDPDAFHTDIDAQVEMLTGGGATSPSQ